MERSVIITAVDRIEGDLLVCSDDVTSTERHLPRAEYPHLSPSDVLRLTLEGDTLLSVELLEEETEKRKKEMKSRLHALFNRHKKS